MDRTSSCRKYWTKEEEEKLAVLAETKLDADIARIMKRSKSSVKGKRIRMGIQCFVEQREVIFGSEIAELVGEESASIYKTWVLKGLNLKKVGPYRAISEQQLKEVLMQETAGIFVKEAQTTAGGAGVSFFEHVEETAWEEIKKIVSSIPTDIVIQRKLVQHSKLAELNGASVNSLRLYSVLHTDGSVKIYSAVLRVGVGDTRVDNYSSGGISCGITEDGTLRRYAYNKKGAKVTEHPITGITLEGFQVPSYDKAVALVQRTHPTIPHFRSVSWDIAIVEDGTPVLIEANLCRGGIDLLQLDNGPLYGDDTEKILAEVFGKRR